MAVVEPISSNDPLTRADERRNVVRLVDLMGPISPELALVDPQLAAHARALLPEPLMAPPLRSLEPLPDLPATEPPEALLPAVAVPVPVAPARTRRPIDRRLVGAVVAGAAAAIVGFGAWTNFTGADGVEPQPVAAEADSTFFSTPPTEAEISPGELATFEAAVNRDPRSPLAREALGTAYFQLRRWTDSESQFRALVELSPSDDFAHFALGRALANQGRQEEAAAQFKLAGSLADGGTP